VNAYQRDKHDAWASLMFIVCYHLPFYEEQ